jgi:sugar phosphate isomerase/epimerase
MGGTLRVGMATGNNHLLRFSYILESPASYADFSSFAGDVKHLAALGYGAIELQLRSPADLNVACATLLNDCGLRLAAFQTGSAYLESGICLASPDPRVRRTATDLLKRYVDLAARFSAVVVFGLLQGTRKEEPDATTARARIEEQLVEVASYAAGAGVTVAVEPVNRYECGVFHNTVADVLTTLARVDSPALRAMVDTFHMNVEERSQAGGIHAAAPVLAHVHLSETNRGLLGSGHLDFAEVFRAVDEVCYGGMLSIGIYRDEPSVAERALTARDFICRVYEATRA